MVACSPADRTAKLARDPVVIFEVLSASTAAQDRIGATVHVRAQDGWSVLVLKDEDTLAMPEIGLSIPLAEFYEGLEFGANSVEGEDNDRPPSATA
jgi:hypothetical protein